MAGFSLKQRIMTRLYYRGSDRSEEPTRIHIDELARDLREDPREVTHICERLIESGLLRGDDDTMMGNVQLSNQGIEYCEGLVSILS
jgi:DNA-binding MarR family transcriptional regulator